MCRHLAFVGPERPIGSLLVDPPHSLEHQSHAPRLQEHATVNADGWGMAWWAPAVRPEPVRYRTTKPIWADRNLSSMADVVCTGALLAAVRSATPPLPVDESGSAPFVDGPWAGSLNGFVTGYRGPAGTALRAQVSDRRLAMLDGTSDAEVLVALVMDRIDAGEDPADAVAGATAAALDVGEGPKNLLLSDGVTIVATAWGNSLFVLHDAGLATSASIVASEPLDDDPAWRCVPDAHLVVARRDRLEITELPT